MPEESLAVVVVPEQFHNIVFKQPMQIYIVIDTRTHPESP